MTKYQRIDYELVTMAVNSTKEWGHETSPVGLHQAIAIHLPTVREAAIIDRCKALFPRLLNLKKRDSAGNFREYAGEHEDDEFFYRGEFYLKRTPRSREYLEELAALIEPEPPPKGPIGFQP